GLGGVTGKGHFTVTNGSDGKLVTFVIFDRIDPSRQNRQSQFKLFDRCNPTNPFSVAFRIIVIIVSPCFVVCLFVSRNIVSIQCRKTKSNGIPKILRGRATGSNSTATGDSHGRQPRATATGDSDGRQPRATGPGDGAQLDSHGRQPRATGPGDGAGRRGRATGPGDGRQ